MKWHTKLRFCLAAVFYILLVGCSAVGPLCRSEEKIRASILKRTPVGCSSNQVYAFIKQQRWQVNGENRRRGFQKHLVGRAGSVEVGRSYVCCDIGVTHFVFFPFATDVLAYWGFDKSGHLIDVWVDRQTDAP